MNITMASRKSAKLKAKKDHFSGVPDGITSKIISMLPLKEAVRTSMLSKQWKYVWTNKSDLLFDSSIIIGSRVCFDNSSCCGPEHERQKQRNQFIERVDHVMHQCCKKGLKIDSLSIYFNLGRDFGYYISEWIRLAVERGVETLDLDLSERCSFRDADVPSDEVELFVFPSALLASRGESCTLKNLKLAFCGLSPLSTSLSLTSLRSVELRDVKISDQEFGVFFSTCSVIETLTLCSCNELVDFKFSCSSSQLKLVRIQDCIRLKSIEVNSEYLTTLDYTGGFVSLLLKRSPKLTKIFMSFTGEKRVEGATYALSRIAYDAPQLETLNIVSVLTMKTIKLPEKAPSFGNIKQLILTVFPFHDEDELQWINYILEAFPLLQELELNLFSPSYIRGMKETDRRLPECAHRHLRKLEIYGFYGNRHEVDLLMYLIGSAVSLEVLVVNLCQKIYKGFDLWEFEEANSWNRQLKMKTLLSLHELVPPTIELTIR